MVMPMDSDTHGLEVLDRPECLALLRSVPLGRIVFTDRALPAVQPVNFTVAEGNVVIRTSAGSKLAAAARRAVVAFEVDEYDAATRTGWSVVIVGQAELVSDPRELEVLETLPLETWAPGLRNHFIRIRPEIMTGRKIPGTVTSTVPDSTVPDSTLPDASLL